MSQFCHLHCHSEYSLLDGMSKVEDMVKRAKELEQPAIALTDHGVMFGAISFYRAAKKADIKPIMGVEAYLATRSRTDRDPVKDRSRFHMLLLAENQQGYLNLLKLSSIAQLEGFYGKPRIDRETLAAHSEGIIASTGCLAAEVPRTLMHEGEEAAYKKLKWYLDVFGRDRFFLELQGHDIEELRGVNRTLIEWSKKYGVGLMATNDVHYVRKEDADPHDALLCIQTHDVLSKKERMRLNPMGSYYITSFEEMMRIFGDYPDALANTVRIAERCEVDLEHKGYHLPEFPLPAGFADAESYLKSLVLKGVAERYGEHRLEVDPILKERVERELFIIHNMGFDNYFLIVWDLCRFAAEDDIWWNVRGSGAGSVVAYTLRITNIDPIKNDLIFERFLNPDRVSMPDIDIDFPDDRRSDMIEYTVRKYGSERCAAIITFGTLGARAAVRDVGRVLEIPLPEVDRVARIVPNVPGKPVNLTSLLFEEAMLEEWPTEATDLREVYHNEPQTKRLLDMAMKLEGQTRHASTHAAGIVISDKPIVEYAPLHRPTKGDDTGPIQQVVQFDMNIVESIGLLKVDFLGLSTLTIMRRACELIEERHGRRLDLNTIPYERVREDHKQDKDIEAAYKLLQSGETVGVFQVEGAGLRRVLTEMRPTEFEHIIAAISLYRPGPMEYIPQYIRRMHGKEPVQYHHPAQEPILQNTFGICVSGDAIVVDARTGERVRLADVGSKTDFMIQGVDGEWRAAVGRVTHWIDSGCKPVYRVTLRNGASVKVTADHRLLTEAGWQPLCELAVGDYIGTPFRLMKEADDTSSIDFRLLRILGYLIGDGSLSSAAVVDFVSKEAEVIYEYIRCLGIFEDIEVSTLTQIRDVTRVSIAKKQSLRKTDYHAPTNLLVWLRELGLKYPAGSKPGGARSQEKFIPDFVFKLGDTEIAYFLASLWDCDGYMGKKLCHYKTISEQLAKDVQTLLLRLGISATIYAADYKTERGRHSTSYQVTVYDTAQLSRLLTPHMASSKRTIVCTGRSRPTLARSAFVTEVKGATPLTGRTLMREYGIDRQHFYPVGQRRARIASDVVATLTQQLELPNTRRALNVNWQEIVSIEPVGTEHVYDLTVEGLHSFVADNIIVHNCVYQEQIMRMATDLAGYSPGEADLMRRAVSKKKAKDIEYHKGIFVKGAVDKGLPQAAAERIYGDIEFFARYGFNKCVAGDTEVIDAETGQVVTVADLHAGSATLNQILSVKLDGLKFRAKSVVNVVENGVKPVFRLTTALGHTITATDNHPFYTREGWKLLGQLQPGEPLAVARHIPARGNSDWDDVDVLELGRLLVDGELREFKPEVFGMSHHHLHLLLSRLGLEGSDPYARFITPSRRLGQQLQHLYLRLGIVAKLEAAEPREGIAEEWALSLVSESSTREDIHWDTVASIEPLGAQMTYDLEVEETHNFIANHILVHNSHAADYAVITVQTAYLKAHYPVEYLCALLEVSFNDTAKVPVLLNECRRMGIVVLPPELNKSGAKFTIEPSPRAAQYAQGDYRRWAIRVGMGAIKNVGLGAVELILAEREQGGVFTSLDDFCERVDLRQINRRVLECLTKVGVFDDMMRPHAPEAPREMMLELLDRMIGVSSQSHEAAEVGQMSMFDMMASSGGQVARGSVLHPLPVLGKINHKQRLADEKELMGLYISEHPLQQVAELVKDKVSYYCNEITADMVGQNVALAGLLVSHRVITTKKGDRMAFLKLEDMQGDIEIVVFPRTYEQCKEMLVPEAILLVAGKVEARNDTFSLLAERIVTYSADATVEVAPRVVQEEMMDYYGEAPPLPPEAMAAAAPANGHDSATNGNGAEVDLLEGSQRLITLTLPRTADAARDVQRLRQLLELVRQNEGGDSVNIAVTLPDGALTRLSFGESLKVRWTAQVREALQGLDVAFSVQDITPDPKARYRKEKAAV